MSPDNNVVPLRADDPYDIFTTVSYISASSLGGVYDKPQLGRWAVDATIDALLDRHEWVAASLDAGARDAVRKWAQTARYEQGDPGVNGARATDVGTALHAYLDHMLTGAPIPDECATVLTAPTVRQMTATMTKAVTDAKLQPVATEQVVVDPERGVSGRADLWATSCLWEGTSVVDLKTAVATHTASGRRKGVYTDGYALQVGAYDLAPYVVPPDIEHTTFNKNGARYYTYRASDIDPAKLWASPPTNGVARILHVTPTRAQLVPIVITAEIADAVATTVQAARWLYEYAKRLPTKAELVCDNPLPVAA
jgi:hypothetical protein